MTEFTAQWIEHLKREIGPRVEATAHGLDAVTLDELVADLAWFTYRFSQNSDTKMRKVGR